MIRNIQHNLNERARKKVFQLEPWQRTLAVMFFAQVCSALGFSIIFPFLPLYVEELGTNTSLSIEFWAGMVFSSQAFTMMIASPFWGALADRYGHKLMVQRAMIGAVVTVLLMGFARSAEELVFYRTLQGLLTGTVSATNAMVAGIAPRNRMGYAMSVIQVGLWGGVALGPMIGGPLADAYGFRFPFYVASALLGVATLLVYFFTSESLPEETRKHNRSRKLMADWRHVLSMKGVLQTYFVSFMTSLSRSMIVPIMPLFMASLLAGNAFQIAPPDMLGGLSPTLARVGTFTGFAIGISSATSTASGVYLGRLGDRVGHRRILIASAVIAILFYVPQAFVTSPWQLILLQGMTGLAFGGLVAAPSALLAHYTQPGEEGAVYGLDNSVVAGARAVAPLIGAGIAFWFGLRMTFMAMGGVFLLVILVVIFLLPAQPLMSQHSPGELQPD